MLFVIVLVMVALVLGLYALSCHQDVESLERSLHRLTKDYNKAVVFELPDAKAREARLKNRIRVLQGEYRSKELFLQGVLDDNENQHETIIELRELEDELRAELTTLFELSDVGDVS